MRVSKGVKPGAPSARSQRNNPMECFLIFDLRPFYPSMPPSVGKMARRTVFARPPH